MRPFLPALLSIVLAIPPAMAQPASVEAQLCRSQLELLVSGGKLSAEEEARFEVQCTCLEENEATSADPCSIEENL